MNGGSGGTRITPAGGPPWPIRAAGVVLGLQGLGMLAVAVVLAMGPGADPGHPGVGPRLAGMFGVFALGLLLVAAGLWRGRLWARTPAIVTQLLALLAVYALLGPYQVLVGLAITLVLVTALLLLLSRPARRWSAEQDEALRRP